MAINEQIITGRKFRKCLDAANKVWMRISFWTSANDVEFDDGRTLQQKLGTIDGITDSLESNDLKSALAAKAGKVLNDRVNELAVKVTENTAKLNGLSFTVLTQAEYDALPVKDAATLYFIYTN
ncbi:MAG: hypothetical protein HFH05_02085 [Lachnospiraceae bacterium]|jgi:hypothetical protein|nr:hypothetical protein [Lachnospiraceae bacterium]MCI9675142.1 hypothetical protein [Lachnospiraceae bacterium]